mgnify:CR=1 FL=1
MSFFKKLLQESRFSKIFDLIGSVIERFYKHNIGYVGGQIAYFFILSIFPFLIFINALIASFNIPGETVFNVLDPFMPERIVSFIARYIEYINSQNSVTLLSIGIIIAIFSSSKSVRSLASAFNKAYEVPSRRGFFAQVAFSMLFIFLFGIILLACIVIVAFGNSFITKLISQITVSFKFIDLLTVWRWVTMSAVLFLIILFLYKILPSAKIKFSEAVPGALFSLVGILILILIFSVYVNNFISYVSFYGSIGAVMLLMLWMYFAGIVIVLGAEINSALSEMKKDKT